MNWLADFTLGLVLTIGAVCAVSYASGYLGEWFRARTRPWLAWRARRPRFDSSDLGRFRHELALWKEHRP